MPYWLCDACKRHGQRFDEICKNSGVNWRRSCILDEYDSFFWSTYSINSSWVVVDE